MTSPQAGSHAQERMRAGKIPLEIMQKFNLSKPLQPLLAGISIEAFNHRVLCSAMVLPAPCLYPRRRTRRHFVPPGITDPELAKRLNQVPSRILALGEEVEAGSVQSDGLGNSKPTASLIKLK